ncbi:MAG: YtxH domain-containing protein [Anaerolineales bacterium]|nr:YtxH domain-containing protein [Anaerolineales bacterium]
MKKQTTDQTAKGNHPGSFVAGMLMGGLAGAGAMLLLAPSSGKRTRAKLQSKGIELREQTVEAVGEAVAQVRGQTQRVTTDLQTKAEHLQQRGQAVLDEQLARVSAAVGAGKALIQGA